MQQNLGTPALSFEIVTLGLVESSDFESTVSGPVASEPSGNLEMQILGFHTRHIYQKS